MDAPLEQQAGKSENTDWERMQHVMEKINLSSGYWRCLMPPGWTWAGLWAPGLEELLEQPHQTTSVTRNPAATNSVEETTWEGSAQEEPSGTKDEHLRAPPRSMNNPHCWALWTSAAPLATVVLCLLFTSGFPCPGPGRTGWTPPPAQHVKPRSGRSLNYCLPKAHIDPVKNQ